MEPNSESSGDAMARRMFEQIYVRLWEGLDHKTAMILARGCHVAATILEEELKTDPRGEFLAREDFAR